MVDFKGVKNKEFKNESKASNKEHIRDFTTLSAEKTAKLVKQAKDSEPTVDHIAQVVDNILNRSGNRQEKMEAITRFNELQSAMQAGTPLDTINEWYKIEDLIDPYDNPKNNLVKQGIKELIQLKEVDQLKKLPEPTIEKLSKVARASAAHKASKTYLDSTKLKHEKVVFNVQEILLNCIHYPKRSKTLIETTRDKNDIKLSVSSTSEALKNLRRYSSEIDSQSLLDALKEIDIHLEGNQSKPHRRSDT